MAATPHGSFSNWSQPRSASPVVSEALPVVTTTEDDDDQAAPSSEDERTDVESTCHLDDPDGPPWHVRLVQKLCRDKRLDEIPGWFDRWDVFLGVHDLTGSIRSVQDDTRQAALRRRVWLWIVLHWILITALVAMGVYVAPLAAWLRDGFHSVAHRAALYASLLCQLILLKLVLDVHSLRRLVFLLYSLTLAALLATAQTSYAHASIVDGCALAILPQLVVLLLCGVQRRTNDGTAVFLNHATVGGVAAMVTSVVAVAVHYACPPPTLFGDSDHVTLVVLALVGVCGRPGGGAALPHARARRDVARPLLSPHGSPRRDARDARRARAHGRRRCGRPRDRHAVGNGPASLCACVGVLQRRLGRWTRLALKLLAPTAVPCGRGTRRRRAMRRRRPGQ